jgi:dihydroflavonol-4-reductase
VGRTLVTGASGFLGSHLARALAERGDALTLLLRRGSSVSHLDDLHFKRVTGDLTDRRAVRRAMDDVDRVFHVAGRTSLQRRHRDAVFAANVRGSRIVFEEALAAEVQRVVYTSSVAAIGTAEPGQTADESTEFRLGRLALPYLDSKHEAELEAMRAAVKGLPVVCVNPTFVFGPDDPKGTSMRLIRRFLTRRIPAYVDGGLNIVDVRDVATGHLLADAKGEVGERYILGGRNFTFQRLFADLARISGVEPPPLRLPPQVALAGARAASLARLPLAVSEEEILSASLWWTYRSTKAKRELGFKARPHEETLEDAVRWQLDALGDRAHRKPGAGWRALVAAGEATRLVGRVASR